MTDESIWLIGVRKLHYSIINSLVFRLVGLANDQSFVIIRQARLDNNIIRFTYTVGAAYCDRFGPDQI